jgi:hypothetical protein
MPAAHQLSGLLAGLTDTCLLLQHQSRAMQQVFAEVLQHWADPRGQRLVATHLEPQAQLLGPTVDALLELTRALEAAARLAERAQAHLEQARVAVNEVQQVGTDTDRLDARARELAILARGRIHSAEAAAQRIGLGLNGLGAPPM